MERQQQRRRDSRKAVTAIAIVVVMALSAAAPALAGRIEKFTTNASEIGLEVAGGKWDNSTSISFPPDSRVRDARVVLKADQSLHTTQIEADRGNVSAWAAKMTAFDPRVLDPALLKVTPFTAGELTAVALNSTASGKTTISENVSAHLFDYDLLGVLGGARRDARLDFYWLGLGTRQGSPGVEEEWLYVSDFSRGVWAQRGHMAITPPQGEAVTLSGSLFAHEGWMDTAGHMYVLIVTTPLNPGTGTSLSTNYVSVAVVQTMSPKDLQIDVGQDGTDEFAWNGTGVGLYGLQNEFANGSDHVESSIAAHSEHRNVTSFLVPKNAVIDEADLTVTGIAGDVTNEASETGRVVDAQGISTGTNVTGIPSYAEPVWAQVVLSGLKNAGMEDQKQTIVSDAINFGNYGIGARSISQTFISSVSGKLVYLNISLEGAVYSNAPNIIVEIRPTNTTGMPLTTVIGSAILNGSMVNQSAPNWYRVPFSNVQLTVGIQYAIVLSVPSAISGQIFKWDNHNIIGGDPYRYGNASRSDTIDGSGPWAIIADTDQAFITYMETDILPSDMSKVRIAGQPYSSTRAGPDGTEYVYNITGAYNDLGTWGFTITNANDFPVLMNWTATLHSDVYPQEFGLDLSTPSGNVSFYSLAGNPIGLSTMSMLSFGGPLGTIIAGAPVAYTSPSGVQFVRVNVTIVGNVTGAAYIDGLRVRYFLNVPITGPKVIAAAEAYRAAHAQSDVIELPIAVYSACRARLLLSDPLLEYDLRPFFVTTTQTLDEDQNRTVDLNTLFGDDYDHGNLSFAVVSVSDPANLTATLTGPVLKLVPVQNYHGELDVVVRGTDSVGLYRDGTIHVIVNSVNDVPVVDLPAEFAVQARSTELFNLSAYITDIDTPIDRLVLQVNSSFITVQGLTLYVTFDDEGLYHINLTVLDGADRVVKDMVFNVSAATGWPSISSDFPNPIIVHINRKVAINLLPYGSDQQDPPAKLKWAVRSNSTLYTAVINASGHWLIVTPTGTGQGKGQVYLTLNDTDGHIVSTEVTINVTGRLLQSPVINYLALPQKIDLKKDGASYVIDLRDYVTDDTPIPDLQVAVAYSVKDIAYVDAQGGKLSFVPQDAGKTKVTVTLTNADQLSSSFNVTVEVKPKPSTTETNWWLWVVVLVILAAIIAVAAWPRRPAGAATAATTPVASSTAVQVEEPPKRGDKVRPHVFHASTLPQLEEVLLFHKDGKLISQHTRRLRDGVDAEIEAGVISAIQDHLRGRLRARDEPADLIELEGMRVVIERGADLAIASVLTGREPDQLRVLMRRTLHEVQTRNESALAEWDGDVGSLHGVDNAMVGLVESLIREPGNAAAPAERGAAPEGWAARAYDTPPAREERPRVREPEEGEEGEMEAAPRPTGEKPSLKLVAGIIGEDRAQELVEGKPKLAKVEGSKDEALVKDMLDREKERESEEGPPSERKSRS